MSVCMIRETDMIGVTVSRTICFGIYDAVILVCALGWT